MARYLALMLEVYWKETEGQAVSGALGTAGHGPRGVSQEHPWGGIGTADRPREEGLWEALAAPGPGLLSPASVAAQGSRGLAPTPQAQDEDTGDQPPLPGR